MSQENTSASENDISAIEVTSDMPMQAQASDELTLNVDQVEKETDTSSDLCYICGKAAAEEKLKSFQEKTWATLKMAASYRKRLKSDKFFSITEKINSMNSTYMSHSYHPSCNKNFTAVKRAHPLELNDQPPAKKSKSQILTRTASPLPKNRDLQDNCLFCGKARKKVKGKEESRQPVRTMGGCESLKERALFSCNERVKHLLRTGVDLIAAEAWYHRSCRAKFYLETDEQEKKPTTSGCHKGAFTSLCSYIQSEAIEKERPLLLSSLLEMYKMEFTSIGGDKDEVDSYQSQNLLRKIKDWYGDRIIIKLADQRRGNFLFSSKIPEDRAVDRLHEDSEQEAQNDRLRWAALHLRSQILKMSKSRTPKPATVQNLKETAPDIPAQVDLFFRSLLGGLTPTFSGSHKENQDRKVTSMSSDAVFNVSRGTVKPWKHTAMGLGIASLTGSKLSLQILNRAGHSISYNETKGLETEFAYSVESCNRDAPDGIRLDPGLATASVWDNNDANVETLDGKQTLHATVGHTYQNIVPDNENTHANPVEFREGRNRRKFIGHSEREIPPFRKSLKMARFTSATQHSDDETNVESGTSIPAASHPDHRVKMNALDLYWLMKLREGDTPLHAGFMSRFIKDPLPLQRICYMDPISMSPTNNDVVRETMLRTMSVARETGQNYSVVTYDLAVALKAYGIQAVEAPLFDNMLILLGNFHVELAFYGAVGTLINESGVEYILTEADMLAEGSMMGFIKGKFYNRCTRVHELLANVLEQKLYNRFLAGLTEEECHSFEDMMNAIPNDPDVIEAYLTDPVINEHLQKYEDYFSSVLDGLLGPTAQFWGIYLFLINRLLRELQRCVKTNDVGGYIAVFPMILDVFFGLNRPNYARWGTLFLQKLETSSPELRSVLERGAFTIRRTKKNFSRSAVDMSLEQTVNRDAASQMKGIVAFRNSEAAMRRWSLTMTQRAMAVSELRTFAGLEVGENAIAQCRPSRIKKDNEQMTALSAKMDEFCNPFSDDAPGSLVNLATGQAASQTTEAYLLNTLKRGAEGRKMFQGEWDTDSSRFLKPVKRIKVQNFAAENVKKKAQLPASQVHKVNAESMRDIFIRMIVIIADKTSFDLKNVLTYPIITHPLALAHSDGGFIKTPKSALLNKLEEMQTEPVTDAELPLSYTEVYDGGLLLHSVLSQINMGTSYATIAKSLLSAVCSGRGNEVHVCLDKYVENSIKDSERKLRGGIDLAYIITGPDQTIRQSGKKLLANGRFKNALATFLLTEWQKNYYWNLFRGKTMVVSFGGECYQYIPSDELENVSVSCPANLQADHEEADTLIGFHVTNINPGSIIVRASDTDVLVILIGVLAQQRPEVRSMEKIIMDCGQGNKRRYINVSNITNVLEEHQTGLARALPGFHAFTGCDFTSAFFRKGKVKPFDILMKDKSGRFVNLFIAMGDPNVTVDINVASQFVCRMYAQSKITDVDEARYNKLVQITGKVYEDNPLANVKRVDCALLPPCKRSLEMKVKRSQYVTMLWIQAPTACPGNGISPTDYGWAESNNLLKPVWYQGPAIPDALFVEDCSDDTIIEAEANPDIAEDEELIDSDEAWSEDSDMEDDEGII